MMKNHTQTPNAKVRRVVLVLLAMLLIFGSVTVHATTSIFYEEQAVSLRDLGLFAGGSTGFGLERVPTRAEAAVMLVRLLGKEEEAKEKNLATSFSDVPDWAGPYVGYMEANNLTAGVGGGLFGSTRVVDAKSYATFILRALGYDDAAGDFSWNDALAFTEQAQLGAGADPTLSVVDFSHVKFRRDEMVLMSWLALSTPVKSGSHTLVEKLVEDGVVSLEKAKWTGAIPEKRYTIQMEMKKDGSRSELTVYFTRLDPELFARISTISLPGAWDIQKTLLQTIRMSLMTEETKARIRDFHMQNPDAFLGDVVAEGNYSQYHHLYLYDKDFEPMYYLEIPKNLPIGMHEFTLSPMTTGQRGEILAQAQVELKQLMIEQVHQIAIVDSSAYHIQTVQGRDYLFIDRDKLPVSARRFERFSTGGESSDDTKQIIERAIHRHWNSGETANPGVREQVYDEDVGIELRYGPYVSVHLYDQEGNYLAAFIIRR